MGLNTPSFVVSSSLDHRMPSFLWKDYYLGYGLPYFLLVSFPLACENILLIVEWRR
jgi:hypothetical protein